MTTASIVRAVARFLGRLLYRVEASGLANVPATGGALLISNHVSYVDTIAQGLACPRPIRYLAWEGLFKVPLLGAVLRGAGAIPVSSRRARDAMRTAVEHLRAGDLVCVFPEGQLTRTGTLLGLRRGFELIARQAGAPVVPCYLDSLWGSVFSYSGGRYFRKWPERLPYPVRVEFGRAIPSAEVDASRARRVLLELGEQAFRARRDLDTTLPEAARRTLARRGGEVLAWDAATGRAVTRREILRAARALAARWRGAGGERLGVVLPPGPEALATFLGLGLAGCTAAPLNPTAGPVALASAMRRAGITRVLHGAAFPARFRAAFPQGTEFEEVAEVGRESAGAGARGGGAPVGGGAASADAEAAVLFTSGSSGEPKGVRFTHRNLLANITQMAETGVIQADDRILACLPLFHSFGLTATVWLPLARGTPIVAVASPLDARGIAAAVRAHGATVLLATPSFLRGLMRRAEPSELAPLRHVITGAEKLAPDLASAFEAKFGARVREGYGLTETSPVAALNIPDPATGNEEDQHQAGARAGSVGRLMPGMAARIVDPGTGADLRLEETGLLLLRGANVFEGYLGDEARTREAFRDGWYMTGDLARFDEDGFLFIEGRLSRFSKIAGEMVPHGVVEEAVAKALGVEDAEAPMVFVAGAPDPARGERLVLVAAVDVDLPALAARLREAGLPNLWIPGETVRVEKIPVLPAGKLDLAACRSLASGG